MSEKLIAGLKQARVVPLVQSDTPPEAVAISQALLNGGLDVLEVVLRTDMALACLKAVAEAFPDAHIGAGTVLSAAQADKAIQNGAKFLVSPGLDDGVVNLAHEAGLTVLPGIATATELQRAWNMGLRIVKFFPASLAGGPKMLTALSAAFRDMQFMPTGGVSADNLSDYLAVPSVIACGGSWLTPASEIAAGNFDAITDLAATAKAIANKSP
jgi:2-dehydro-3-deoxyphosphogluconate aldolase/(4S)-4-hydroxy-2-oxoglutarate aldolase